MSGISDCVALGPHWDRSDHLAAATRMRAIADVVRSCPEPKAVEHDPGAKRSSGGQLAPPKSTVLWRRSILHQNGTRASVVANVVATSCGHRSRIEFELRGHPDVKDMAAHVHLPIGMNDDVDCVMVADVAACVLERSIDARAERVEAYRRLSTTAEALGIVCRDRWLTGDKSLFQTIETLSSTPWRSADALLHQGPDKLVMLRNGGREIVARQLPMAMTVDWTDETQKGTGQRTVLLTMKPYSALSIVSGHGDPDAMTVLRANALLPLAEDQLCRLA